MSTGAQTIFIRVFSCSYKHCFQVNALPTLLSKSKGCLPYGIFLEDAYKSWLGYTSSQGSRRLRLVLAWGDGVASGLFLPVWVLPNLEQSGSR